MWAAANRAMLGQMRSTNELCLFIVRIQSDANKFEKLKYRCTLLWKAKQIAADKSAVEA